MSENHAAVAIFEIGKQELLEMMEAHGLKAQENLRKCELYLAEMKFSPDGNQWGSKWKSVEDVLGTIMRSIRNRVVETQWYVEHLSDGPFRLTGAQLVGFKNAFAPFDLNVERAILSIHDAQAPNTQPERELAELHVQIPRMSMPPGAIQ